jgi:hypothetical protein
VVAVEVLVAVELQHSAILLVLVVLASNGL